jgi:acetoacetyl-CoA synthetase
MSVLWAPAPERIEQARITAFVDWLATERGLTFPDYEALWSWSVTDLEGFWSAIWQFFDVQASHPYERVLADKRMPGAVWFPGARLNFVDQVFRHRTPARPAIVFRNEAGERTEIGWEDLYAQVTNLATGLRKLGIKPGDRVVAYLPNVPETVVAFLAVAAVGAVWSLCSPDMGPVAVLDRFRQIEPKVLIACDGYRYGGKAYERGDVVAQLRAELPSVRHTIGVGTLNKRAAFPGALDWSELVKAQSNAQSLQTEHVAFDHPLWVVYSSGTTGMPKAIVHGHGGILIETLKGTGLHNDVGPADRFNWYSSTGWIMWNCQVAALLVGCTICIYDGNPGWPDFRALWRFVAEERITFFGAGAAYYANCIKAGVEPGKDFDLSALRALGSTGSPLSTDAYRWIYTAVKRDLWLTAVSGGTDFAGAFVTGLTTLPVYEGEMQCRALGAKVEAWDESGAPKLDEVGELVCAAPMPSMPLYFWNDPGDARLRESYFDMFPGVWRHGDWIRLVPRPEAVGSIIYGRSDATINRHGIRMGTAELYRAVEALPEVLDSLVVDLEFLGRESYMPLFVVLRPGVELDEPLRARINGEIKLALSARHVPNEIIAINEVPRTLSGKKMELPIKKLLLGHPLEKVANPDAMANPASLNWFVAFASARAAQQSQSR